MITKYPKTKVILKLDDTLFIEVAKNGHKDFAELLLQNNVSDFRGYEASIKMTLPRTYH